jgi:hypothetical protein
LLLCWRFWKILPCWHSLLRKPINSDILLGQATLHSCQRNLQPQQGNRNMQIAKGDSDRFSMI